MEFENTPVDASGRIEDDLMDSMEPFDVGKAVPFDMRYLAGYMADRFDVAKEEIADRARGRMFTTAEGAVQPSLSAYLNTKRTGGWLNASITAKYLLLPVYLFSIQYGGEEYEFAVNGQTGRTVGHLPTDGRVGRSYFLLRFTLAAAIFIAIYVGRYLLGR